MLRSIYRFTSSLSTASVSSPLAVLFPPSVEYLVTSLSLSQADVNKITKNHGHIENMSIEQLSTKLSFLASPPLNLTTPEQRFLILRIPQILTASSSLLSSKLDFFRSKFTLNSTELRKIIIKNPHVLTCSVCSNELKFDYLTTRLDLTNEQLRKILFRQPQVLSCSIATNLSPTISFLESRLELSAAELRTVILQFPEMLGFNLVDKMDAKLGYLTLRLSLTEKELRALILQYPVFLGANVIDNIEPSIAFYEDLLGVDEALAHIQKNFNVLNYSVAKRLVPRRERMESAGLEITEKDLRAITRKTNAQFDEFIEQKLVLEKK